jgi:two-component system sensor histidine kinase NreB
VQDGVRLEVEDDGAGFDATAIGAPLPPGRASGWGVVGMRERAALVGGQFIIRSEVGRGTVLIVELPLPAEGRDNGPRAGAAG